MNAKRKGKTGELDACKWLKSLGFTTTQRTVQYNGRNGASDIICEELKHLFIEVKREKKIDIGTERLRDAVNRAIADCGDKFPIILWRHNHQDWRLSWEDAGNIITICDTPDRMKNRLALLNSNARTL